MDKSRGLDVVEYREGGKVIRLFLRHRQDPLPAVPDGIKDLRFHWLDLGPVYQVTFLVDGCKHFHQYPVHEVARCEEEHPSR